MFLTLRFYLWPGKVEMNVNCMIRKLYGVVIAYDIEKIESKNINQMHFEVR